MTEFDITFWRALLVFALIGFITSFYLLYKFLMWVSFVFIPGLFYIIKRFILALRFRSLFGELPAIKKVAKADQQELIYKKLHQLAVEIEKNKGLTEEEADQALQKFWKAWKVALSNGFKLHYERQTPELTYQHYLPESRS